MASKLGFGPEEAPVDCPMSFSLVMSYFVAAFICSEFKSWSRFLRQGFKVDLTTRRTIHHEDAQTVHG
jgi:hypothetical protein